jgi:hypothetical protein
LDWRILGDAKIASIPLLDAMRPPPE